MPETYFVVEFRFGYHSNEKDLEKAVEQARREFGEQYGFVPEKWKCHIFEFSSEDGTIGEQKHYFFSPEGTMTKEIHQNIEQHNERVRKGT